LRQADAVFLTNSVRFLSPVVSLDGEPLKQTEAEAPARLREAVAAAVRAECGFNLTVAERT
jgi:branched-subunit amino acid aminotransferase/4-amino-4-deoxychorismate lyase